MSLITLAAIGARTRLRAEYRVGDGTMTCIPGGGGIWGAPSNEVPLYLLAVESGTEYGEPPVQAVYAVVDRDDDTLTVAIQEGADQYFAAGSHLFLCTDTGTGGGTPSYSLPAFTSFLISGQATILEVGASVASGDHTFTWATSNSTNVQTDSVAIADTTAGSDLATGLANDGTEVITLADAITNTAQATQVWTVRATNTHGGVFSRTFAVNWFWKVYAGTSANATLTAAQVKALADFAALESGFPGTYPLSAGDYKYFCYPDAMGDATSFRDPNTSFLIAMATSVDDAAYSHVQANGWAYALVSVTNAQSVAANYRVFRSQYPLGGSITFQVT